MIAVPVFLFYFLLGMFAILAACMVAASVLVIVLFWNLRTLSSMALSGVEEARNGLTYMKGFLTLSSYL